MRVAYVSQAYAPVRGGSEWVAQQLSERSLARGHVVRVFTSTAQHDVGFTDPTAPSMRAGEDQVNGVPITRFPIRFGLQRVCQAGRLAARLPVARIRESLDAHARGPALRGIAGAVAAWQPDVAVAVPASSSVLVYTLAARRRARGNLAVVTIPCFHAFDPTSNHPAVISRIARADAVIVFTTHERDELVAQGVSRDRVTVAGLGVDPTPLDDDEALSHDFRAKYNVGRSPLIAFVGRKQRYKGVWFLIEAMQQVWQWVPDVRLVVAGGRTIESPHMQRELGYMPRHCQARIIWIDDFADEDKRSILAAADVIALPSLHESFGLVYLDAWLHKKPVIGCRLGSTTSLVDDEVDGLLVTFEDHRGLARAVLRLMAAPALRARMGEAGYRKLLRHYTWGAVIDRYEQAYAEAANHARAERRRTA